MIERVCIVITPSPFLADERVFPSLGPLKVASSLEKSGFPVDVLDLSGVANSDVVIKNYVQGDGKDVTRFGLTATTPQFPQAVRICETLREVAPESRIVIGGPHATLVGSGYKYDQMLGREGRGTHAFNQMTEIFDTSVLGDGELAGLIALTTDAPKVIDASFKDSPLFIQKGRIDDHPMPARHLIDMDSYHYKIDGKDAQSMIAQYGCPFECGFCGGRLTPTFRLARQRDVNSVMDEVDILVRKYNRRGIMFYDDELNINNDRLIELLERLISYQETNNLELRLRGFVKAELFTSQQANLMYKAGYRILLSGVESGSSVILDTMKKHTTPEINAEWISKCHTAGLQAKALMSIGHPGESERTITDSLEWVLTNRPDDVDWTVITQYPGTPYFDFSNPHPTDEGVWVYDQPQTAGVLYSRDVNFSQKAEYYKGVPGDYTSYVWTDHLSPEELVRMRDKCETVSRAALGIPPIVAIAAMQFEHSMGQSLPKHLLRRSLSD